MHKLPESTIQQPLIGLVMGSQSDWKTMKHAEEILIKLKIPHETKIVSAHRTPERLTEYATNAHSRGIKVIIAGAGGAAHLPGMMAGMTTLPVLGVPIESHALNGVDSLLSICQMPAGIPVGTLSIGRSGAINAALLSAAILAGTNSEIEKALSEWRLLQTRTVPEEPDRKK